MADLIEPVANRSATGISIICDGCPESNQTLPRATLVAATGAARRQGWLAYVVDGETRHRCGSCQAAREAAEGEQA